jgi:hypothetical protein
MAKKKTTKRKARSTNTPEETKILQVSVAYKDEAEHAKFDRMEMNRDNWDVFHLRGDYSHKLKGQSQEFLPKQSLATEQFAAFIQQGLVDMDDWFSIESRLGLEGLEQFMILSPYEAEKIVRRYLEKAKFYQTVNDFMKLACNESLVIAKVHGCRVPKPKYRVKQSFTEGGKKKYDLLKTKDTVWELRVSPVRGEDFYPDPSGRGMYFMEEIEMDTYELRKLAEGPNAIYDKDAVEKAIKDFKATGTDERDERRAREMGQNMEADSIRKKIRIFECWGNIIDPVTGDLLHENVMWTCANDFKNLIQKPVRNPYWHGRIPYVVTPILRVPNSVWHKALNDAPTFLNLAQNELFNLMLDGALKSVHNIGQIRREWLDDENQVSNGIPAGTVLDVSTAAPVGAKAYEELTTGKVPQDGLAMYELLNSEFNQAALSNELRLGQLPGRSVKATEVVEASQSLTNLFSGVAKNIEKEFITPIIEMSLMTIAQHADDLDDAELESELGADKARRLALVPRPELFKAVVEGFKYKVNGISTILSRMKNHQKLMVFLQTIGQSDVLIQEFAKKYSFEKMLGIVMKSLDINGEELTADQPTNPIAELAQSQAAGQPPAEGEQVGGENDLNNVQDAGQLGDIFNRAEFAPQPAETVPLRGEQ